MNMIEQASVHELAAGVFARQEVDNMGWIIVDDQLLVVDALEQASSWPDVLAQIRKTAGADFSVKAVLNTHTHDDHTALNDKFAELGAEIINLRVSDVPEAGMVFRGNRGREVHYLPMPGCHTFYDAVVWLPNERVLFVGDLFGWGLIPYDGNLRGDVFDRVVAAYRRLIDYDPVHVVPGHGPLMGKAELERCLQYFFDVVEECRRLRAAGVGLDEMRDSVAPPTDMHDWWRFTAWKHADTVKKVSKAVVNGWLSNA